MKSLKKKIVIKDVNPNTSFIDAYNIGNQALQEAKATSFSFEYDSISNEIIVYYDIRSKKEDFGTLFGPGKVPGLFSKEDMIMIFELCKKLPNNGIIVEVGSFLGKSSVELAKSCKILKKNFKIICIDSFNSPLPILHELLDEAGFDIPSGNNQIEMFQYYTRDYNNIKPLKTFFNNSFQFDQKIHMLFEDSDHKAETLTHALPFWWSKLESGGILAGHDFYLADVNASVNTFAILNDLEVKLAENGSSIWYIEKN